MSPCTATRRITTNLQTKDTQNYQKVELYVSPTTKDVKKPYSSRQVGEAELESQGRDDVVWCREAKVVAAAECVVPHSHMVDKNQEGYLGNE